MNELGLQIRSEVLKDFLKTSDYMEHLGENRTWHWFYCYVLGKPFIIFQVFIFQLNPWALTSDSYKFKLDEN